MSSVMSGAMRRVLLLGSGFTSAPAVEYLTRKGDYAVTVASDSMAQADQLAKTYQNTTAKELDIRDEQALRKTIADHELVISLVPYLFHSMVAKHCLATRTHMVTSSYILPTLQALHHPAVEQGLTFMNEVGLDPGIDHMLALQCIDEVHEKGGKIISYESWCGGLPHPHNADNPLKYKFSWNPSSMLQAIKSEAKYIKDKKVMEIPTGKVMDPEHISVFEPEDSPMDGVEFEGFYNRDSIEYVDIYNIPEAETVIRGTYRYKGHCKIIRALYKVGLLDATERERLQPEAPDLQWKDLVDLLLTGVHSSLLEAVEGDTEIVKAFEGLRLLSDDPVKFRGSPFGTLCDHLERILKLRVGEKDAIYLHNFVGIQWPDNKIEKRRIYLNHYGPMGLPGQFTAMAQLVGQPVAIASKMVLEGKVNRKGVVIPNTSDLYKPILESLEDEGIVATIKRTYQ